MAGGDSVSLGPLQHLRVFLLPNPSHIALFHILIDPHQWCTDTYDLAKQTLSASGEGSENNRVTTIFTPTKKDDNDDQNGGNR